MKKLFFCGMVVLAASGLLIIKKQSAISAQVQSNTSQESGSNKLVPLSTRLPIEDNKFATDSDGFSRLPAVENIMDFYRTKTNLELRSEIVRITKIVQTRNLYERANSGTISFSEKTDLAYFIRLNSALHRLLIDREIAIR